LPALPPLRPVWLRLAGVRDPRRLLLALALAAESLVLPVVLDARPVILGHRRPPSFARGRCAPVNRGETARPNWRGAVTSRQVRRVPASALVLVCVLALGVGAARPATIRGTLGPDRLIGTVRPDTIFGRAGADRL